MAEPLYCAPSTTSTPEAHAADDAVADGKVLRERDGAHGKLGHNQAFGSDLRRQLAILRRVYHVHAAAQHGDRLAATLQRALVRRGIDSTRHAADDGESRVGEVGRKPFRDRQAVRRGAARSHHSDHQALQQFDIAAREQQQSEDRRSRAEAADRRRRRGVTSVAPVWRNFCCCAAASSKEHPLATVRATPPFNPAASSSLTRGAKDALRAAKTFDEQPRFPSSQTGDHAEGQPVKLLFRRHDTRLHD